MAGKDLATVDATREVTVPPQDLEAQTVTVAPGQAHLGDLRSASGLGLGDGLLTHSSKWLQVRPCLLWLSRSRTRCCMLPGSLCQSCCCRQLGHTAALQRLLLPSMGNADLVQHRHIYVLVLLPAPVTDKVPRRRTGTCLATPKARCSSFRRLRRSKCTAPWSRRLGVCAHSAM